MRNSEERKHLSVALLVSAIIIVTFYQCKPNSTKEADSGSTAAIKLLHLKDLDGRAEDDELLLAFTKDVLIEPSSREVPYFLDKPKTADFSGLNSSMIMYSLLKNRRNGFFVDCGAFDGERGSASIGLEKDFNWTGLLVDAAPREIQKILMKGRKAWFSPTCMSTTNKAMMVSFEEKGMQSKILSSKSTPTGKVIQSLCIPFHTFMNAMGVTKVDLFSLDVEGNELQILKTIDFNRVPIDAMIIEHYNNNETVRKEIVLIMEQNGFKFYQENAYDFLFIHTRV